MKLTLRRDTAKRIVARLLIEAARLERNHRTPVTGEKFTVRPVTIEREIARLRRWAHQLRKAIARGSAPKMHRPEPIRRFRAPAEIPLGTVRTALASELSHRPRPATPDSGTLSPALTAAPAGAALGEDQVVVRKFVAVTAPRRREDGAPDMLLPEKREY
jgi:hypothetical protein